MRTFHSHCKQRGGSLLQIGHVLSFFFFSLSFFFPCLSAVDPKTDFALEWMLVVC